MLPLGVEGKHRVGKVVEFLRQSEREAFDSIIPLELDLRVIRQLCELRHNLNSQSGLSYFFAPVYKPAQDTLYQLIQQHYSSQY